MKVVSAHWFTEPLCLKNIKQLSIGLKLLFPKTSCASQQLCLYFARFICSVECESIKCICLFLFSSCDWFACSTHWKSRRSRKWESAEKGKNKKRRVNQRFYTTRQPTSRLEKTLRLGGLSRNWPCVSPLQLPDYRSKSAPLRVSFLLRLTLTHNHARKHRCWRCLGQRRASWSSSGGERRRCSRWTRARRGLGGLLTRDKWQGWRWGKQQDGCACLFAEYQCCCKQCEHDFVNI